MDDIVNGVPPGSGLSATGVDEARALGRLLESDSLDLGVSSRLQRARDTLELALADRTIPLVVEPLLDEIGFGSFEGGPLLAYRGWAWEHGPDAACPGDGECRASAAGRLADGLTALVRRREATVLAISHGLPVRYVLDAADGGFPGATRRARPARRRPTDSSGRRWSGRPRATRVGCVAPLRRYPVRWMSGSRSPSMHTAA